MRKFKRFKHHKIQASQFLLAEELRRQGYMVSHVTVARCLRELGYSLQQIPPSRE
jgi:hypothetical protein